MSSSVKKDIPCYIVGLPESPVESEEAKLKFERLSGELVKVFPYIEEIRAVVKSKKTAKDHGRYDVSVEVYTPRETHSFAESGYNLATLFDSLGPRMKRLLSSKRSRVTGSGGQTRRKAVDQA